MAITVKSGQPWRDEDLLETLYVNENLTQREIADQFGCSNVTISNWLKKFDMSEKDKRWKDEDLLKTLYIDENLTQREIADQFECGRRTISNWLKKFDISEDRSVECPECGERYTSIGNHWYTNPSHRPELSDRQKDIVTGMMMSDGSLLRSGKNPYLRIDMITKEYLEHLDDIFGILTTGVKEGPTAEELAERVRERGIRPNAKRENYNDVYRLQTRRLPELQKWDWYTGADSKKVWPEDIQLTPTVLKHFHAGDGSLNQGISFIFGMKNEMDNTEKVSQLFKQSGLPAPDRYDRNGKKAVFNKEKSRELFEYMGSPPPGFEYKWPEKFR